MASTDNALARRVALFGEVIAQRLEEIGGPREGPNTGGTHGMTPRRMESLYAVAVDDLSNAAAAAALCISVNTIEVHLSACRDVLDYGSPREMTHDLFRRFVRLEALREVALIGA